MQISLLRPLHKLFHSLKFNWFFFCCFCLLAVLCVLCYRYPAADTIQYRYSATDTLLHMYIN